MNRSKKIIKRFLFIIVFVAVITIVFTIEFKTVFDWTQILVLFLGTVLLYMADKEFRINEFSPGELGKSALLAGCIESLILFIGKYGAVNDMITNVKWSEIVQSIRPVTYGFCIWFILGGDMPPIGKDNPDGTAGMENEGFKHDAYCEMLRSKGLTGREVEIAILVIQGMTNAEIAYELNIAETTVKKHMSNIFEKLNITRRDEIKKIQ